MWLSYEGQPSPLASKKSHERDGLVVCRRRRVSGADDAAVVLGDRYDGGTGWYVVFEVWPAGGRRVEGRVLEAVGGRVLDGDKEGFIIRRELGATHLGTDRHTIEVL